MLQHGFDVSWSEGRSRLAMGMDIEHTKDSDCAVNPANDCCTTCGVMHGDACARCGQHAFHADDCPELQSECASCQGFGRNETETGNCPACNGTGRTQ
jgi:hypothetical protein